MAQVSWDADRATLVQMRLGADDDELISAIVGAAKAGIDCPLGWPQSFVAFLAEHERGDIRDVAEPADMAWRRTLAFRRTDMAVHAALGYWPLSVAADKICHPAMSMAVLLSRLSGRLGSAVQRDGSGVLVEVYPAASLATWTLPHRGYRGSGKENHQARAELVALLRGRAPWLDFGPFESVCCSSDDALDAVVAALTARAVALGQTATPAPEYASHARTEGWIALPTAQISDLVSGPAPTATL